MKLNETSAKIFGYFWRYGAVLLGLICSVLFGIFVTPHFLTLGLFVTFAIIGVEYIIASALNMPHIFVVYASMNHDASIWKNMYENRNKTTRKEMYKNGGFIAGFEALFAVADLIVMFVLKG